MTEHTDIDRLLETWFDDGPTMLPDRVVTVVADRIARQGQRRAWRSDRRPIVNLFLKVAVAAAIGIALLGGAVFLAGNRNNGPAPAPEASPSASAAPASPAAVRPARRPASRTPSGPAGSPTTPAATSSAPAAARST